MYVWLHTEDDMAWVNLRIINYLRIKKGTEKKSFSYTAADNKHGHSHIQLLLWAFFSSLKSNLLSCQNSKKYFFFVEV